ncbi:hypothetical protein OFEAOIEE_LOCUS304 [Methylorubrum extorquens]
MDSCQDRIESVARNGDAYVTPWLDKRRECEAEKFVAAIRRDDLFGAQAVMAGYGGAELSRQRIWIALQGLARDIG